MAYTLDYDTITALVNNEYLPVMVDNIFTENHYLWKLLKDRYKTYNEREILQPLQYAKSSTFQFMSRFGVAQLRPEEYATGAKFAPGMGTASFTLGLEDELENQSDNAILSLLESGMENVESSMEEGLASHIWTRGHSLIQTDDQKAYKWNQMDHLVNADTAVAVGGIPASGTTPSWWLSKEIDLQGAGFTGDPTSEADLTDPSKDVHFKRILQRGVAKAKYQTGKKPDLIIAPQQFWDIVENNTDEKKRTSALTEKIGSLGFSALDFRNIPIIADDDMVAAQTGDDDGRIYFLHTKHLYLFLNSGAAFKATDFVRPANQNAKSCLINAYGNLAVSNRRSQCYAKGILSEMAYAA